MRLLALIVRNQHFVIIDPFKYQVDMVTPMVGIVATGGTDIARLLLAERDDLPIPVVAQEFPEHDRLIGVRHVDTRVLQQCRKSDGAAVPRIYFPVEM